ncbi:MAG: glycosyltransferase [Spirochaetales bacterium]|uniref:Glycosyltransferase n=1 Tax=Candidatus Thalassospirochaeta sargassi TaxID=3119039 RepID=A0AAJ1IEZ3_9SPIO|nr:glycosyltransferase [Spirochaetales bacterium]
MSVYNKENCEYFRDSLNSLFNQTLLPSEIVLVHDGPLTEKLYEVIESFKNKKIPIVELKFKENKGLGKALSEGLKKCSFDLVGRMDTDDIAKYNRFEKQVNFLNNNINIDLVSSWVGEFRNSIEDVISIRKVPETMTDIINFVKIRSPVNHPAVMFKKTSVLKAGNYQDFSFNEDYYLWMRMLAGGAQFYNIQENLLYFRISEDVYKRRGGLQYCKKDIALQKEMLKLGLVNTFEMYKNILLRVPVRLIPNRMRKFIYNKFLR